MKNVFCFCAAAGSLLLLAGSLQAAQTNRWIRSGRDADAKVSTASNWSLGHVPTEEEIALFSGRYSSSAIWDDAAPHRVAGIITEPGYLAVITINTSRSSVFPMLSVTGDLIFEGGALTHPENQDEDLWLLALEVGGDCKIGEGAAISVSGKGYAPGKGPSPGIEPGFGASHGGQGAPRSMAETTRPQPCYGSVTLPDCSGSGGTVVEGTSFGGHGGGVLHLSVAGNLTVDGQIRANADGRSVEKSLIGGASGGSILIRCGKTLSIREKGRIQAYGGRACGGGGGGGGGGRIAIYYEKDSGNQLQGYRNYLLAQHVSADGGCGDTEEINRGKPSVDRHIRGAAGTVYIQHQTFGKKGVADGVVHVFGWQQPTLATTRIPADIGETAFTELRDAGLVISDNGYVTLTGMLEVRTLGFGGNGTMDLNNGMLVSGNVWIWDINRAFSTPGFYTDKNADSQFGNIFFSNGRIELRPYFKPIDPEE